MEILRDERTPAEVLSSWVEKANYEILPTEKALSLVDVIPLKNQISVTCRPTGIEDTIRFIEALGREKAGRVTVHIAAGRIRDEKHFDEVMARLLKIGTKRVFVVGGDGTPDGEVFTYAEKVIRAFWQRGIKFERIGVGGYPEGNSAFSMDPIEVLLRKQSLAEEMGVDMEILTQVCFDVDVLIDWIKEIRSRGVKLPVVVGMPGKWTLTTMVNVLGMLGIHDALAFIKSKPKLAKSLAEGVLGAFTPAEMLRELAEKNRPKLGIRGISIFTLGNVTGSVKSLQELV